MGSSFATLPGGKGANQAVAAARLGADVRMIGRVGDDAFGPMLLASLEANGVRVEDVADHARHVVRRRRHPARRRAAELHRRHLRREHGVRRVLQLQAASRALEGADALLLQMEIPLDVSLEAAAIARRMGVRVIYDPAPPSKLGPASACAAFDIVAPNQSEAEVLTGVTVDGIDSARPRRRGSSPARAAPGRGHREREAW